MGHRTQLPRVSCTYRYDPYQMESAIVMEEETFALPTDTLHIELANKVSFMPYPEEEFYCAPADLPKDTMSRLFIGQLPYGVTDMQLQWLCSTFGDGVRVHHIERIVKHDTAKTGTKVPTGCIHAYCHPDSAEKLMDAMHKKILIDDTGVWYAQTDSELAALHEYCSTMKRDRSKRPHNRPYDTVVAQLATSTYVPKPPAYHSFAAKLGAAPSYQTAVACGPATPPPQY